MCSNILVMQTYVQSIAIVENREEKGGERILLLRDNMSELLNFYSREFNSPVSHTVTFLEVLFI